MQLIVATGKPLCVWNSPMKLFWEPQDGLDKISYVYIMKSMKLCVPLLSLKYEDIQY